MQTIVGMFIAVSCVASSADPGECANTADSSTAGCQSYDMPAEKFLLAVSDLLNVKDLLPISDICSKLNLDRTGCLRVETYLGTTLRNLTKPLHLKHKVIDASTPHEGNPLNTVGGMTTIADLKGFADGHTFEESSVYIPGAGASRPFILATNDQNYLTPFKYPTLVKVAPEPDLNGNHAIIRVLRRHHETPMEKLSSIDIPFQDKMDALVWRGDFSGQCTFNDIPCNTKKGGPWPNRSRILLVQKYHNASDARIDVGFAHECRGVTKAWARGRMSMASQLKYKFIMVVEGGAMASNHEWVMASNSVPFMAKSALQTWSLISWLQPWQHYVPVEPDFSDLSAKLDWAKSNPVRVAQIAREGAAFMQEFRNKDREHRIAAAVLAAYFNRFRVEDSPNETSLFLEPIGRYGIPLSMNQGRSYSE